MDCALESVNAFARPILVRLRSVPQVLSVPCVAPGAAAMQVVGRLAQFFRFIAHGSLLGPKSGDRRVLRTDSARFDDLPDFPFTAHFFTHNGCRLHYIDEGPKDAEEVIVCLHGQPTWSFLYRRMIPPLVAEGYRVVALDFLGAGKSDKPVDASDLTYCGHVDSVKVLFDHLHLREVTLVMQDWGGMIGTGALPNLSLRRVVIMDTWPGPEMHDCLSFVVFCLWNGLTRLLGRRIEAGKLVRDYTTAPGCPPPTPEVIRGYDAPFPSAEYKAMIATWPLFYSHGWRGVIPLLRAGQLWAADNLRIPVLVAFASHDILWNANMAWPKLQRWLRCACPLERHDIPDAAHFLQEGNPREVCRAMIGFINRNPTR